MKKITLSLLFFTLSLGIIAQEKEKQQEIGIAFNSLNNFTLMYKTGTEKALWRYNIFVGSFNNSKTDNTLNNDYRNNRNINFGISLGKEFRETITDKLTYRYGLDVGFNYFNQKIENFDGITTSINDNNGFSTSIAAVIGVNYKLSNSWFFGAEILPNVSYTVGTQNNGTLTNNTKSWSAGLSNGNARLSISYIF